ncbi:TerD family protein [Streptomyces sp. NPDC096033]|uniref:TerD family protein n=1 Tax=Streptomyces sp. NPDC096033 TaxID=3366071 RepID=UPI003825C43F
MTTALVKGGNVVLSKQAPGLTTVTVGLGWRMPALGDGGYEVDASALMCDGAGRVLSDQHFVFFNNPRGPDGSVTLAKDAEAVGGTDVERIDVDLVRVPAGVAKIVFPVSLYEADRRGQSFGQVTGAYIRVVDRGSGRELARYDLTAGASAETAMVFGELYRHGTEWKFRAIGQGYASGLAGIATDYGVDVLHADAGPATASASLPAAPHAPAFAAPQAMPDTSSPIHGSSTMTCFFDPHHGAGTMWVTWSPQWGTPRQVQTCGSCAQRVQSTPPPYYGAPPSADPYAGYPVPAQQGYPQQGYAQEGYPQTSGENQPRRFGAGALIGAGAAGLVGGALLNEAFSDDEHDGHH